MINKKNEVIYVRTWMTRSHVCIRIYVYDNAFVAHYHAQDSTEARCDQYIIMV